jgi:hypothetical protein
VHLIEHTSTPFNIDEAEGRSQWRHPLSIGYVQFPDINHIIVHCASFTVSLHKGSSRWCFNEENISPVQYAIWTKTGTQWGQH